MQSTYSRDLNVLVQLAEEWVCICEDVCSLKYAAVRKVILEILMLKPKSIHLLVPNNLAEEGGVAPHEGRQRVQDDMLLSLLHMKIVVVRVAGKYQLVQNTSFASQYECGHILHANYLTLNIFRKHHLKFHQPHQSFVNF